jgi:hypothetical protein
MMYDSCMSVRKCAQLVAIGMQTVCSKACPPSVTHMFLSKHREYFVKIGVFFHT